MTAIPRKLADFGDLTTAEQQVLDGISSGQPVIIGDGELPSVGAGDDRRIRAGFVRYLLLGGCDALAESNITLPETGVRIMGGLIDGELNLVGCRIPRDIGLVKCRLTHAPVLRSAEIDNLFLDGAECPGLVADRLSARDSVFLRASTVTGPVRLLGAKIGGDLSCIGATFTDEAPLGADGITMSGSVFLAQGTFKAPVRLLGARVGGTLSCSGAGFEGDLELDRCRVTGTFFWRENARIDGDLSLSAASFGAINDDPACWPDAGKLVLDRCQYGALLGTGVNARDRIRWLGLPDHTRYGKDFWPQPYEQCAKVLREMGHGRDANLVLMEKEKLQRRWNRTKLKGIRFRWLGHFLWDNILRWTIGYGRRPFRAAYWLTGFWVFGILLYGYVWNQGAFKPNNAFVIRAPEWVLCATPVDEKVKMAARDTAQAGLRLPDETRAECYIRQPEGANYPRFNAFAYSADTLLPIVSLEMQEYWLPDETAGRQGFWARVFLWAQIFAGWALSLLAVAGFGGLIKSD